MTTRIRILYCLFALSGFSGLIYESIWSHYLKLFLGHAVYAQTVVLIVFIGGLALGSWLAGLLAHRLKRPLLLYAAIEFCVGVAALLFHSIFVGATGWAYGNLLPALCSAESWCWAQWAFAAALILPQSILLGATFPLMSGGILRLDANLPGSKLSLLYFLNSFGAVVGVLASGFVLIPQVGLPGALATAGIVNISLALVVYFVDKNTAPAARIQLDAVMPHGDARLPAGARVLLLIALLTGLSSFIYEIAWIRSLSLVLGASTHSFELMLASFILGIALGGLWIRSRIDSIRDTIRFLAIVQVLMGLLAVLTLPVYNMTFELMSWLLGAIQSSDGGWVMFNVFSTVICLLVMLPATFLAGMTLPLITYTLLRSRMGERSIGQVYAANTLGGIIGVIIAVHFALPVLGLKGALVVGGAIDVALGAYLLLRARDARRTSGLAWSATGIAGILAVALLFHLDPLRLASGVYRFGAPNLSTAFEVLYHKDGKTATIDVYRHRISGIVTIATNGKADGAVNPEGALKGPGPDEYTMTMLGSMAFAHRPDAKTVAVIGYGTGMSTTTALGSSTVERVDTIEIEPSMFEGAQHFRFFTEPAYSDPRSHVIIDDAKSYFARSQRRYDVIISEPSNPWVSGVSSLFTREFYKRIRGQLSDGGLLVQWLHTYSFSEPLLASVIAALRESFPEFVLYAANNGDLVVVASPHGPVPPLKADIFSLGKLPAYLSRVEIRRIEDLGVRRVGDQATAHAMFGLLGAPVNSDYFPVVDSHAGKARFLNSSVTQLNELGSAPWPILDMTEKGALPPSYPITLAKWPTGDRVREAQFAENARRYLVGESTREQVLAGIGEYDRALSLFKTRYIDCVANIAPMEWWDTAIATGGLVSVYLSREASDQVWNLVDKSRCAAKLDADEKRWFALFRAVGRRDLDATAELSQSLLERASAGGQIEYLYGAAMTALIGAGRADEARQLQQKNVGRIPAQRLRLGWFRWLGSAALVTVK